ncbi:unnamed protein product [Meloidogyne enterolobii]|uniref:Uncharacterized protein n=1 Tax=Meloidogyne enterolobii TaxID=390850 RepID=A0ACB1ABI6_MELEN
MAFVGQLKTADGEILAVDGLKEKLDAAWNHGISKIILPRNMEKQVKLLGEWVQQGFNLIYINSFFDAVKYLFPVRL